MRSEKSGSRAGGTLKIAIVGVPSDMDKGLGAQARAVLDEAGAVFCAKRMFDAFSRDRLLGRKLVLFPDRLTDLPAVIESWASAQGARRCRAAVLATGDPDFFGITAFLTRRFPDEIEAVLPAPSIMQEAFALLRLNWEDAGFFSLHGKSADGLLPFILSRQKGFIFTAGAADVLRVLKLLKDMRLTDVHVHLFENLGTSACRITAIDFPFMLRRSLSDLNALVFLRECGPGSYIGLGLDEARFLSKKGMITKREVRVNALALLDLRPGNVLWDIGAGSGSLSIEASFNPVGVRVFAVESDEASFGNLKENIRSFGAVNVMPILAAFSRVCASLPAPDRIFVGGGGREWRRNLSAAYDRLQPGGAIVVSAVTLESLTGAIRFFSAARVRYTVTGITATRGDDATGRTILKAGNPVFLIRAVK